MFIDSHAHLEMPQFDHDRPDVIERARKSGVEQIITIGTNTEYSRKAVEIADKFDGIFAAIGVHPHDVKSMKDEDYDILRELATHKKVVAYGEIGLDFYRNLSSREIQMEKFREQIQFAKELKLPIIVHNREAHKEILAILQEERAWTQRGVIHCFSGDHAMAKKCIDMGFYLSIPGTITFQQAPRLRNLILCFDLNQIMIETDCPFLAPVPFRGKRNEPSYVKYIAEKIAKLKKMSIEDVAARTSENAKALFGK